MLHCRVELFLFICFLLCLGTNTGQIGVLHLTSQFYVGHSFVNTLKFLVMNYNYLAMNYKTGAEFCRIVQSRLLCECQPFSILHNEHVKFES